MKTIGLLCILVVRTQTMNLEEPWELIDELGGAGGIGGGGAGGGGGGGGGAGGGGYGGGGFGGGGYGGGIGPEGGFGGGGIGEICAVCEEAAAEAHGRIVDQIGDFLGNIFHPDPTRHTLEIGKRNIDLATITKLASFVETHRNYLDDLVHIVKNVTHVTAAKMEGLLKDFTNNPSEETLTKIVIYAQAHHLIQDAVLQWIEKHVPAVTAFALKELLTSHKRQTTDILAQFRQMGFQVLTSFSSLVHTLKSFVRGQLQNFLKALLPHHVYHPHLRALVQHGRYRLDTSRDALDAVKLAVGDILQETAKHNPPVANRTLSHVESTVESTLSPRTTTPAFY